MSLVIRIEEHKDIQPIHTLTKRAFADRPYAGGNEQDIIDRLRELAALTLSLVAIQDEKVVGHIAFSPAIAGDKSNPWFALGPVSVDPSCQRQGIGSQLIEVGLEMIEAEGALGCILTGNPDFYRRFGFELAPEHVPVGEPAKNFMVRWMGDYRPIGAFQFHPAFYEK